MPDCQCAYAAADVLRTWHRPAVYIWKQKASRMDDIIRPRNMGMVTSYSLRPEIQGLGEFKLKEQQ
jgi:hypothetical protein